MVVYVVRNGAINCEFELRLKLFGYQVFQSVHHLISHGFLHVDRETIGK